MSGTLLGFTHLNHVLFNLNLNVFNQPRILVSGIHNKIQSDGKIINETLEKLINNSAKNIIEKLNI
jgi:predicted translin family RNA/ssDNA-binding protein